MATKISELEDFALNMSSEEEEDNDEVEEEDDEEEEDDDGVDDREFEEQKEQNPLDSVEVNADDASRVSHFEQFDHVEYEVLAAKKRKGNVDNKCSMSGKKARLEDLSGASMDEIMEAMNYGIRRKSRKPKKRGRKRGSKNKLSPEITRMLGDATVLYARGQCEEAIAVLNEVVRLAPHVPSSYHMLGLVHIKLGNTEKAMGFYTIAARLVPKEFPFWRKLFDWHNDRGDVARARMCLSRAIRADPNDIALRVLHASLFVKLGELQRAAESYERISRICPEDVEALKISAKLYSECGQTERSVSILEDYLKGHPSGADFGVIDLLAAVLMETNAHNNALQHIEHAHLVYYQGKEMPLQLKIKAGICHLYLGNIEKAEILFSDLQGVSTSNHAGLIVDVADAFMRLGHFHAALKYYHMLESNARVENEGNIHLKIAQCYLSLNSRHSAIKFFYKALHALEDSVDCRLALASLILEDCKEDEAISLLLPPQNLDSVNLSYEQQKQWWFDGKIKLKLCYIYRAKGMLGDFVNTIFPLVRESLYVKTLRQKAKRRLTMSVLRKRTKILDVGEAVDVFGGVRPLASRSDLLKASRARRLLQKKEEQKAVARAAGIDWHSDDSDNQSSEEEVRVPPLPNFLKNEEHHQLIVDLCKALQSLQRYWEALELIDLIRRVAYKKLPIQKKEELQSLAAEISYKTTDPKHGFDCIRSIVMQHPYNIAAWNCYYKITSRLGKNYSKHAKFLRYMRTKHDDCAAPIVIYGHQFTVGNHHQDAAREYLAAYKLLPESPLINLCVGTALINLALGFRLQNKHQCLAQGLSFLYNNLCIAEKSKVSLQEALYNIARAYHHVGLVSLAASYYEKVLQTSEKDYPIPKLLNENSDVSKNLKPGYCDVQREAAYNLHLIYKKSGALDLARQVLKDHCTF